MSSINIDISFNNSYGERGSANGEFQYPSGITLLNDEVYVVDKQNHRIQVFDLDGNYIRQFGTEGAGNDNFFFPEGIANDGTNLHIVDGANHRIKRHQPNGVFVSEFGSEGSGTFNFKYPVGIDIDTELGHLYIADKQNHRVKVHSYTGDHILTFGLFGIENENLNFPEDVARFDSRLIIADSANKEVKVFSLTGQYVGKVSDKTFDYPVGVININNDIIGVVDAAGHELSFFDSVLQEITTYGSEGVGANEFLFPRSAYWLDSIMYVTDSANHRVKVLNAVIEDNIPIYSDDILALSKQLHATGRAWWINFKTDLYNLYKGLSYSESRAVEYAESILDSILPDNDNFSTEDAANWESALGLIINENISLEERKAAILRKMQHPGNVPARQHYLYLEYQLQLAGFDVYVTENRFETATPGVYEVLDPDSINVSFVQMGAGSQFGRVQLGGGQGTAVYTILGNHIDESKEDVNLNDIISASQFGSAQMGGATQLSSGLGYSRDELLRSTIYISAKNLAGNANVPVNRKDEFRELILKIKPAHTVAFLFVNYV
jgi:DNA-binding beta-propeller fold protein YncE/uncharacterized protein YmfQ (DUF2313 family)